MSIYFKLSNMKVTYRYISNNADSRTSTETYVASIISADKYRSNIKNRLETHVAAIIYV